ncbi:hypothetical protein ANTPLA_LOCUS4589 [Anthophora plagiata]
MMNAKTCAWRGKGARKKSPEVPSHRFVVPVCATRCGLTQKGLRSQGSRVTERAGKGKIRRQQQQAGGKTKNRPAYIEPACDDDDDRGGYDNDNDDDDDDEGGTHT